MASATTRTNAEWLAALNSAGPEREGAIGDLRAIILAGLPHALTNWLSPSDPHFDDMAQDVTQECLLRVLDSMHTFEQRSHFTTWVHKIAVRIALTELRRLRWKDTSLDALVDAQGDAMLSMNARTPGQMIEQQDMLAIVQRLLMEELTDKQRQAMMAVNVHGMPLEEVARQMGTTRNALYKLLHDARLRLRRRIEREGLTPQDVLASFETT